MTFITATTHSKNPLADPVNEFFLSEHFPQALSNIINEYVMQRPGCFGGAKFLNFFGVNVGNPVLPYDEFVSWWNDFDAVDLVEKVKNPRMNWQTHLDPIFRPQSIRDISSGKDQAYNLETLAKYAAQPLGGGHPTTIRQDNEVFKQHARTLAGPGCWIVRRKEIVARNQSYNEGREYIARLNETRAGYEPENTLLDLATDAAVRHVFKGERHFGDSTGIEGRWTFARSGDLVQYGNNSYPSALGGFALSSGVDVYSLYVCDSESVGVAALRKFWATWILDT